MTDPTYDRDDIRISELRAVGFTEAQAIGLVIKEAREEMAAALKAEASDDFDFDDALPADVWGANMVLRSKENLHKFSPLGALVYPHHQPIF